MLVAGDHARKDMAVDWKDALEKAGHPVQCAFTGLGELGWVQEMYRERLLEVIGPLREGHVTTGRALAPTG